MLMNIHLRKYTALHRCYSLVNFICETSRFSWINRTIPTTESASEGRLPGTLGRSMDTGIALGFLTVIFFFNPYSGLHSQTTIGHPTKPGSEIKRDVSTKKHKILLVPLEPKMYMSEIDHKLNGETHWSQQKIKAVFRDGIDDQLYQHLKPHFNVLSLLDDTLKYKKDILKIYQYLSYKYQPVPDQKNYQAPKNEKEKSGINKGQIMVETRSDARFMNAKITNPSLVPELFAKYKTDVFLFINQLNLSAGMASASDPTKAPERTLTLHYTAYTVDAKEINSGIAECHFPVDVNNPTKINAVYVAKLAEEICKRLQKALIPAH